MGGRCKEYTKKLLTAGIGKRPMIWVCHSMGGLLVKRMLVDGSFRYPLIAEKISIL